MLSHPSECAYLIPAEGERRKTNKLLGQARDLIAKAVEIKDGKKLTNPTIEEMTNRVADAEACTLDANSTWEAYRQACKNASWARTQVNGVIRQLNYELNYHLAGETRETRITLYGFNWVGHDLT